jgi:hypothetical protein
LLHGFNIAAANLFRSNTDVVPASAYENKRLQCPPRANAAIDPVFWRSVSWAGATALRRKSLPRKRSSLTETEG